MLEYFTEKKDEILRILGNFLKQQEKAFSETGRFGAATLTRIHEYAVRGKILRGGLVMLGHDLWNGTEAPAAFLTAAALELFQSALLIHDDIMDRDLVRRGMPTMHVQYADECRADGLSDPGHAGEALAICTGDIAFFLGFQILSSLPIEPSISVKIMELFSLEMSLVGSAQMLDAWSGALPASGELPAAKNTADRDDILNLYRFKTGRYTIALPIEAGLILGGAPGEIVQSARGLGEILGIMFQIKDDEMGLFGLDAEIGKPVGSDIREGKKTVYYEALMRLAQEKDRRRLVSIFGRKDLDASDIGYVRDLVTGLGIRDEIEREVQEMLAMANKKLMELDFKNKPAAGILEELAAYCAERTS